MIHDGGPSDAAARALTVIDGIRHEHSDNDRLTDSRAPAALVHRLPDGFGRSTAHEILHEVNPVRDCAIEEVDAFLG
ncbi:MAG: hypothetical protein P0Y59_15725 [Candidatus Sphingomonas phytovorans]|nr:hypothetical protein [Sphingomonas sp.]WEJ98388.1 MAG: hypothetical protein P0Y59_15725 [Sphingomonas sp.]